MTSESGVTPRTIRLREDDESREEAALQQSRAFLADELNELETLKDEAEARATAAEGRAANVEQRLRDRDFELTVHGLSDGEVASLRSWEVRTSASRTFSDVIDELMSLENGTEGVRVAKELVVPIVSICVGALELNPDSIHNLEIAKERILVALGLLKHARGFFAKDADVFAIITQAITAAAALVTISSRI